MGLSTVTGPTADRLTASIGAELRGINIADPLTPQDVASIADAVVEHGVVFLPDQDVTTEEYIEFARLLGEPTPPHPFWPGLADGNGVVFDPYGQKPPPATDGGPRFRRWGDDWHSDLSCMERPPAITLLLLTQAPPIGGDTLWASGIAAYDRLSEPIRELADRLVAVHDGNRVFLDELAKHGPGQWEGEVIEHRFRPVEHPVVRTHPVTGRRSLFVNPLFTRSIRDLSPHESARLLDLLIEHLVKPEHTVRYRWSPGTLAIWDNRSTVHYAVGDYDDAPRRVRRITLRGDRPVGPATRATW